jgi:p-aminobenzoyl-glutamate transporter AbgT
VIYFELFGGLAFGFHPLAGKMQIKAGIATGFVASM